MIRDDACALWDKSLTSSARDLLWRNVISPASSPVQRGALIKAILSGSFPYAADSVFLTLTLSGDELRDIENFLTIKPDRTRKLIIMKLLMETEAAPEKLEEIITRLQKDEQPLKRKAADEILRIVRRRRDEPLYRSLYERLASGAI